MSNPRATKIVLRTLYVIALFIIILAVIVIIKVPYEARPSQPPVHAYGDMDYIDLLDTPQYDIVPVDFKISIDNKLIIFRSTITAHKYKNGDIVIVQMYPVQVMSIIYNDIYTTYIVH